MKDCLHTLMERTNYRAICGELDRYANERKPLPSLTKFDRRKDEYHEYDEEKKEKKKNRRESKKRAGIRGRFLPSIYFPPRETFFSVKNVLFWSPPFAPWQNHLQWDYGSKSEGTR